MFSANFTAFFGFYPHSHCLLSFLFLIFAVFVKKYFPCVLDVMVRMFFLLFFVNIRVFSQSFLAFFLSFQELEESFESNRNGSNSEGSSSGSDR